MDNYSYNNADGWKDYEDYDRYYNGDFEHSDLTYTEGSQEPVAWFTGETNGDYLDQTIPDDDDEGNDEEKLEEEDEEEFEKEDEYKADEENEDDDDDESDEVGYYWITEYRHGLEIHDDHYYGSDDEDSDY